MEMLVMLKQPLLLKIGGATRAVFNKLVLLHNFALDNRAKPNF